MLSLPVVLIFRFIWVELQVSKMNLKQLLDNRKDKLIIRLALYVNEGL